MQKYLEFVQQTFFYYSFFYLKRDVVSGLRLLYLVFSTYHDKETEPCFINKSSNISLVHIFGIIVVSSIVD